MATLVIPDAFQIGIEMSASGQQVMNVIGVKNLGGLGIADTLAVVKSAWEATNGPLFRHLTSCSMVGYHGVDLSSPTAPVASLGSTAIGGMSGSNATLAACAIVKLSSGTRSRTMQGRLFHGPLGEDQINSDGRTIVGGSLTELGNAYEQFRAALDTAGNPWAVLSRKALIATPISSVSVGGIIGTQRRRLR